VNHSGFLAAVSQGRDGLYLDIHVQPGAKKQQLRGMYGDTVKIALQARAMDGKANRALVTFIAKSVSLPRQRVRLVSGQTSRRKRIYIQGEADALMRQLSVWLGNL